MVTLEGCLETAPRFRARMDSNCAVVTVENIYGFTRFAHRAVTEGSLVAAYQVGATNLL